MTKQMIPATETIRTSPSDQFLYTKYSNHWAESFVNIKPPQDK